MLLPMPENVHFGPATAVAMLKGHIAVPSWTKKHIQNSDFDPCDISCQAEVVGGPDTDTDDVNVDADVDVTDTEMCECFSSHLS